MQKHKRQPIGLWDVYGRIGEPPLYNETGYPAVRLFHYLNQWCGCYQILHFNQDARTYSGTFHGDSTSIDGHYYICIPGSVKADDSASYVQRQLHGALLPWYDDINYDGTGGFLDWPKITWQQQGGAEQTLWYSKNSEELVNVAENKDLKWGSVIQLGDNTWDDIFTYDPDSGGDWIYGRVSTYKLRTAALGVWAGPDWQLTNNEAQIYPSNVSPGKIIRGYDSSVPIGKRSLGDLIHFVGTGSGTDDDLFQNTKRCLFGWAHPLGVWTDTSTYYDLGRSETTYLVTRQRHNSSYESTNFEAKVAVVASCAWDTVNDAYLKISSVTAGDTIEWTFNANTDDGWGAAGLENPEMFTNADADGTGILELASAGDSIKIDIGADGATELLVHAIYIWDKDYDA